MKRAEPDEEHVQYLAGPELGQSPLLITMDQAAWLAQVSVRTIRDWLNLPGFPVMRSTRQVRIHARLFDEWLMARAQAGAGVERDDVA